MLDTLDWLTHLLHTLGQEEFVDYLLPHRYINSTSEDESGVTQINFCNAIRDFVVRFVKNTPISVDDNLPYAYTYAKLDYTTINAKNQSKPAITQVNLITLGNGAANAIRIANALADLNLEINIFAFDPIAIYDNLTEDCCRLPKIVKMFAGLYAEEEYSLNSTALLPEAVYSETQLQTYTVPGHQALMIAQKTRGGFEQNNGEFYDCNTWEQNLAAVPKLCRDFMLQMLQQWGLPLSQDLCLTPTQQAQLWDEVALEIKSYNALNQTFYSLRKLFCGERRVIYEFKNDFFEYGLTAVPELNVFLANACCSLHQHFLSTFKHAEIIEALPVTFKKLEILERLPTEPEEIKAILVVVTQLLAAIKNIEKITDLFYYNTLIIKAASIITDAEFQQYLHTYFYSTLMQSCENLALNSWDLAHDHPSMQALEQILHILQLICNLLKQFDRRTLHSDHDPEQQLDYLCDNMLANLRPIMLLVNLFTELRDIQAQMQAEVCHQELIPKLETFKANILYLQNKVTPNWQHANFFFGAMLDYYRVLDITCREQIRPIQKIDNYKLGVNEFWQILIFNLPTTAKNFPTILEHLHANWDKVVTTKTLDLLTDKISAAEQQYWQTNIATCKNSAFDNCDFEAQISLMHNWQQQLQQNNYQAATIIAINPLLLQQIQVAQFCYKVKDFQQQILQTNNSQMWPMLAILLKAIQSSAAKLGDSQQINAGMLALQACQRIIDTHLLVNKLQTSTLLIREFYLSDQQALTNEIAAIQTLQNLQPEIITAACSRIQQFMQQRQQQAEEIHAAEIAAEKQAELEAAQAELELKQAELELKKKESELQQAELKAAQLAAEKAAQAKAEQDRRTKIAEAEKQRKIHYATTQQHLQHWCTQVEQLEINGKNGPAMHALWREYKQIKLSHNSNDTANLWVDAEQYWQTKVAAHNTNMYRLAQIAQNRRKLLDYIATIETQIISRLNKTCFCVAWLFGQKMKAAKISALCAQLRNQVDELALADDPIAAALNKQILVGKSNLSLHTAITQHRGFKHPWRKPETSSAVLAKAILKKLK